MKEPSPSVERSRRRVGLAAGAVGVGAVTLVGGVWLFRAPIIESVIVDLAAKRGLEATFDIARADFGGLTIRDLSVAADGVPQLLSEEVAVRFRLGWTGPSVTMVSAAAPQVYVRLDEDGFSSPLIDALLRGDDEPPESEPLPKVAIAIEDGAILVDTPLGRAVGSLEAQGVLTETLTATLDLPDTTLADGAQRIIGLSAQARARTENGILLVEATGGLDTADLGWRGRGMRLKAQAAIPRIASDARMNLSAGLDLLESKGLEARDVALDVTVDPIQEGWRVEARASAPAIIGNSVTATALEASASAQGPLSALEGSWKATGKRVAIAGVAADAPTAQGAFTIARPADEPMVASATGLFDLSAASIEPATRAAWLSAIPALDGAPGGALAASLRAALDQGLGAFSARAKAELHWRDGAGRLTVFDPLAASLAGGGELAFSTGDRRGPVTIALPSGAVSAKGALSLRGPGLPNARIDFDRLESGRNGFDAEGALVIPNWRVGGDALMLRPAPFAISSDARGGAFKIVGRPVLTSSGGAIAAADLTIPLDVEAQWAGPSYAVSLGEGCAPVRAMALQAAGHTFTDVAFALCPGAGGVLAGARLNGARYGGFTIEAPNLTGRLDRSAAQVSAGRIEAANVGAGAEGRFELAVVDLVYRLALDDGRTIGLDAKTLSARTGEPDGPPFRGALAGARYVDPALGVAVTEMAAGWRAVERGDGVAIELVDGVARISDVRPEAVPADAWLPRFNPLVAHGVELTLASGRMDGAGDLLLAEGRRALARFEMRHDLETGIGQAEAVNPALAFSETLDLFEITELARGVVDQVTGPVAIAARADWTRNAFTTAGSIEPKAVAFNTASLGPVRGLSGKIVFDDLIALTTPPNQIITIDSINPGVPVENGEIALRLLGPDRVEIQRASWPFADGRLSVAPLVLPIGSPDFALTLTLDEVDVAQFLERLAIKDLTATGKVEGVFPLIFTKAGGRIVDGRLRAAEGGGVIRYTSAAAEGIEGASSWVFDALSAFQYDTLQLELNGDLDGELVTGIYFTGENLAPLDSLPAQRAIPLPFGRVDTTGLDFVFNVSVRAPFRNLVDSYASTQDARPIVDEAIRTGTVDQNAPAQ